MSLDDAKKFAWAKFPCPVVGEETTPERGVIRLEKWEEGYVLWFHGEIVWKSWA